MEFLVGSFTGFVIFSEFHRFFFKIAYLFNVINVNHQNE